MKMCSAAAALCLAVVLGLTSVQMAMARGGGGTAGWMVICTGSGPVAIAMDADGQPAGPAHVCPDCALGLFAAPPPAETRAPRPGDTAARLAPALADAAAPARAPGATPLARGPPAIA